MAGGNGASDAEAVEDVRNRRGKVREREILVRRFLGQPRELDLLDPLWRIWPQMRPAACILRILPRPTGTEP